jgi:hypothetical protein
VASKEGGGGALAPRQGLVGGPSPSQLKVMMRMQASLTREREGGRDLSAPKSIVLPSRRWLRSGPPGSGCSCWGVRVWGTSNLVWLLGRGWWGVRTTKFGPFHCSCWGVRGCAWASSSRGYAALGGGIQWWCRLRPIHLWCLCWGWHWPTGGPEAGGGRRITDAGGNDGEEEESLVCSRCLISP